MDGNPQSVYCALIVAGGTGTRLGAGMPKQLLPLHGRPILAHTIDRFLDFNDSLTVMVVLHASLMGDWTKWVEEHFNHASQSRIHACAGGAERTESVESGLNALLAYGLPSTAWVAIHDAVRPFVDNDFLGRGFEMAERLGNATAGVPVKSSLRILTETGSRAVDRSQYFHVQTPQIFRLGEISSCYQKRRAGHLYTDDASLAEEQGMEIFLFEGHYDNIKITTMEDLFVAERLMARK